MSSGVGSIGYSYDGVYWTDVSAGLVSSVFAGMTETNAIAWNGMYWLAGFNGTSNRIARSTDGKTWSGLDGTSTFTNSCESLLWSGAMWIGGGKSSTNTGVLAYSYNNGETWTNATCPIDVSVTGLATNGKVMVAIGIGSTHTIAYSYNGGITWTGAGVTMFANSGTRAGVKWVVNKFVAFSSGTNTLAYSYDGIRWMRLTNSTGIFETAAYGGDCATALAHTVTFPSNVLLMGNLVSMDGGLAWVSGPATIPPTTEVMGWNGRQYILADSSGNISISISISFCHSFDNEFYCSMASQIVNKDKYKMDKIDYLFGDISHFFTSNFNSNLYAPAIIKSYNPIIEWVSLAKS
jgi:hypothetical protein